MHVEDLVVLDSREEGVDVLLAPDADEDLLRRIDARASEPDLSQAPFVEEPVRDVGHLEVIGGERVRRRLVPGDAARVEALAVTLGLVCPEECASGRHETERDEGGDASEDEQQDLADLHTDTLRVPVSFHSVTHASQLWA